MACEAGHRQTSFRFTPVRFVQPLFPNILKLSPNTTVAFAREGAKIAINYLPEEEKDAEALADFLRRDPCVEHDLIRIPGDLRSQKFCHDLVHTAHKKLGSLDLIVSNAG